jgi:hypothetical protein
LNGVIFVAKNKEFVLGISASRAQSYWKTGELGLVFFSEGIALTMIELQYVSEI